MNCQNYQKPECVTIDYITKNGLMDVPIGGGCGGGQMGNEASLKPFEDEEEDDQQSKYYNEFWDDEEE